MKSYTIEMSKTSNNGATWREQRPEVVGYRAALAAAKALSRSGNGIILLRDNETKRARAI